MTSKQQKSPSTSAMASPSLTDNNDNISAIADERQLSEGKNRSSVNIDLQKPRKSSNPPAPLPSKSDDLNGSPSHKPNRSATEVKLPHVTDLALNSEDQLGAQKSLSVAASSPALTITSASSSGKTYKSDDGIVMVALPDENSSPEFQRQASQLSSDFVGTPLPQTPSQSSKSDPTEIEIGLKKSKSRSSKSSSKKKSSWYNAFYPTYKSRADSFRKLFSNLPADERLIGDFSCALQRDILVHGRMYVTKNYLCFYANIFSWETSVAIRWTDVTGITKERTALVIPNAIQVTTETEKNFFTSFGSRDKAFLMLEKLWQKSRLDEPTSQAEIWGLIHEAYGNELGLTTDDEDYVNPFCPIELDKYDDVSSMSFSNFSSVPSFNNGSHLAVGDNKLDLTMFDDKDLSKRDKKKKKKKSKSKTSMAPLNAPDENGAGRASSGDDLEEDEVTDEVEARENTGRSKRVRKEERDPSTKHHSDGGLSSEAKIAFDRWQGFQEGRRMISEFFPINVDSLFTLLFTKSNFYLDFHHSRKTFDIVQSPWQEKANSGEKTREVSLTLTLSHPMGPKNSQVTEVQTLLQDYTVPGEMYAVSVETTNSGIPYADSFYVLLNFAMVKVTQNRSRLVVYASIKYRKAVWGLVKTFIEKNTWSGLEEFYQTLSKALLKECEKLSGNSVELTPAASEAQERSATYIQGEMAKEKEEPCGRVPPSTSVSGRDDIREAPRRPTSTASSMGTSDNLFKVILFFLIALLLANSLLFYQMLYLETRLSKETSRFGNDKYLIDQLQTLHEMWSEEPDESLEHKGHVRSTEEWIRILQKQELIHQMELEKWHEILQAATELLRKTETSLSNLQRSIHPLTMQKLKSLLQVQLNQNDEISSANDFSTVTKDSVSSEKPHTRQTNKEDL